MRMAKLNVKNEGTSTSFVLTAFPNEIYLCTQNVAQIECCIKTEAATLFTLEMTLEDAIAELDDAMSYDKYKEIEFRQRGLIT